MTKVVVSNQRGERLGALIIDKSNKEAPIVPADGSGPIVSGIAIELNNQFVRNGKRNGENELQWLDFGAEKTEFFNDPITGLPGKRETVPVRRVKLADAGFPNAVKQNVLRPKFGYLKAEIEE